MSEETVPKYITYMTKGIHNAIYNQGYQEEFLEEMKNLWVNHGASAASAMSEANAQPKKPTLWAISLECSIAALDLMENNRIQVNKLPDLIVEKLHSYNIVASDRTVVNIVQDTMWRMDEGMKTLRRNRILNQIY